MSGRLLTVVTQLRKRHIHALVIVAGGVVPMALISNWVAAMWAAVAAGWSYVAMRWMDLYAQRTEEAEWLRAGARWWGEDV